MHDDGSDEPKYNTILQSIKVVVFEGVHFSYLFRQICCSSTRNKTAISPARISISHKSNEEEFCPFSCTVYVGKASCSASFDGDEGNSHYLPSNDWTTVSNVLERIGK